MSSNVYWLIHQCLSSGCGISGLDEKADPSCSIFDRKATPNPYSIVKLKNNPGMKIKPYSPWKNISQFLSRVATKYNGHDKVMKAYISGYWLNGSTWSFLRIPPHTTTTLDLYIGCTQALVQRSLLYMQTLTKSYLLFS